MYEEISASSMPFEAALFTPQKAGNQLTKQSAIEKDNSSEA